MELFTVCVTATAEDIERARPLCLEWVKSQGRTAHTAEMMLPTPLSETGSQPATHYLCATQLTAEQLDHMQAFIVEHAVPVKAECVAPQAGDGTHFRDPNRDMWLGHQNLRIVCH